jgi:hypothetical protein
MVEGWRFRSAVMGEEKIKSLGGAPAASSFFGLVFCIFLMFQNPPPHENSV